MQAFQIPSNGALLNAFVYVAAEPGPHPLVILLHGFPGNERNQDLAQDARRAGWDVLYFDYRGSWGSPGDFSFSHAIEDTAAAIAYLRQPSMTKLLRLDPSRVVLIGHSMGGFLAVQDAAVDPAVMAVGLISATDLGGRIPQPLPEEGRQAAIQALTGAYAAEGMAPLAGCTPEGLARETLANAASWSFVNKVAALKWMPTLLVTSNDGFGPANATFAAALREAGNERVATIHLPTDHSYSDRRGALSSAVLQWLATLPPRASTPLTTEHFSGHPGGEVYGLPFTPERVGAEWLRTRTPLRGLFLTGADALVSGVVGSRLGGVFATAAIEGVGVLRRLPREARKLRQSVMPAERKVLSVLPRRGARGLFR